MASIEYDDLIIGGMLQGDPERWKRALHECQPEHFVGTHQVLYRMASRFYRATGYPIDYARFTDMAAEVDPALRISLDAEFSRLWWLPVEEAHFRWAIKAIRDKRRDERLIATFLEGMKAMTEGLGGEQGYDAARARLSAGLAEIDRHFAPATPYGNIREDAGLVWAAYEEAIQTAGVTPEGVLTGLPEVDQRIVNLRRGENMLVAAYSGEGKTTLIQNIVWHATVVQRKNVLVLTNENQYDAYRARVYNRHAHHLIAGGLSYNDIRTGQLSPEQAQAWWATCNDFGSSTEYGRLEIVQMPTGASMEWVLGALERYADEMDVDLVALDYIGRLGAMTKRPTRREEINDSINAWASALVGYDHGRGVPGITGYQIGREKWQTAQMTGFYNLDCLAETAEAERNAAVVMTVLRLPDVEREARAQLVKNRDGATMEPTPIRTDFATTLVTSAGTGGWGL